MSPGPPLGTPPRIDIESIHAQAMVCTDCRLAETRTQVVWSAGNLDSDVLFVGEAPGFHEDKEGVAFVGAAGKLLDTLLAEVGLDRNQVAIVNVIKCRPPNNRDPLPDEIEACRPYLEAQLGHMQPKVIVTLGNFATRFITGLQIGITKARGQFFQYGGATVIPTFHPAAALRGGRFGGMSPVDAIREDLATVRRILDETRARAAAAAEDAAPGPSEQLGLF